MFTLSLPHFSDATIIYVSLMLPAPRCCRFSIIDYQIRFSSLFAAAAELFAIIISCHFFFSPRFFCRFMIFSRHTSRHSRHVFAPSYVLSMFADAAAHAMPPFAAISRRIFFLCAQSAI